MAYTTIDDPTQYFNTVTWTGTSDATTAVTGVGHQPDFVWVKNRAVADDHTLHDPVRGGTKTLFSNADNSEGTNAESIKSFDTDGFTTGNHRGTGGNDGNTMVAWNWKETATAGFDIVTYTGDGTSDDSKTVSHSLSAAPNMIIVKCRSATGSWQTSSTALGWNNVLLLDTDAAKSADTYAYGVSGVTPSSSTFTVSASSGGNHTNTNLATYVAYLWSEKQGFSKFGSYIGNGGSQNFIYTGFKPAFVIFKKSSGTNHWNLYDNKRNTSNPESNLHYPSLSDTEASFAAVDFVSNGISIKTDNTNFNDSGGTYIYMAFAEAPFVNSNGVPCNAR